MLISFVIPAYNASATISHTLDSIYYYQAPTGWDFEVIVVDDGSEDSNALYKITESYEKLHLVIHKTNCGMCASRNSGIINTQGDMVIILDADDKLIDDWPKALQKICDSWPNNVNLCYAACKNLSGKMTVSKPNYTGYLFLDDILNERYSGEYIPLFRGMYIRSKLYIDLKMSKSCGIVSYINFAMDGPFWISNQILRIYNDAQIDSISHDWTNPHKARETIACYNTLFERYTSIYKKYAPKIYRTKQLRLAIYRKLADEPYAWHAWRQGFALGVLCEAVTVAFLLVIGPALRVAIIVKLKSIGLIRRYG